MDAGSGSIDLTRRRLLAGGLAVAGAAVLGVRPSAVAGQGGGLPFRPPQADPGGTLELPAGFQYRIISEEGTKLAAGGRVPGDHDGMAALPGPGGTTILVRNHELMSGERPAVEGSRPYDADSPGGTTDIVVGRDRDVLASLVTSSGTDRNCSGGPDAVGDVVDCEEANELDRPALRPSTAMCSRWTPRALRTS